MVINKDFREFIELLNKHEVKYLVVGGYAVAFHGHPRYTKDLDVWVWLEEQNAEKIIDVLKDFGFASLQFSKEDFLNPNNIIQLGQPPNRIDLLTGLSGVDFKECYDKKNVITINNLEVNIIDLDSLRRNKKASGRFQDLADLENLS